jgi:hypothetical protein
MVTLCWPLILTNTPTCIMVSVVWKGALHQGACP